MLRSLTLFGLLLFMLSCHKKVDPLDKPALVFVQDDSKCGSCGGWIIKVDGMEFRAEVAAEFAKPDTAVWLLYEKDESSELKKMGNWIKILSIRERRP